MSSGAPAPDLFRSERIRRRRAVNRFVELLATAAALLAVGVLVIVVASVAKRGAGVMKKLSQCHVAGTPELSLVGL